MTLRRPNAVLLLAALSLLAFAGAPLRAQTDPATEPAVLAVGKAMPAVVNINTERVVRRTVRDPYDDFFNNFFGGPTGRSRTLQQKIQSLGSGFIVDPAGYIVTNEHVVERAEGLKISVTTTDGKTYNARYITGSAETDLALIKIESKEKLPFIDLDNLSPNLLAQSVLVLGNPLGYGSSVARGVLSAKGRTITVEEVEYKDLIQTDAAINPGNSGGPLIDLSGRLVGVSSVKMAFTPQGVPTQGIGFAISGEVVHDRVAEFRKKAATQKTPKQTAESSSLARKYFGLQLQDITAELAESLSLTPGAGVLIAGVDPQSAAEEAGIKRGLVIQQVGRYPVASSKQIEQLLEPIAAGSVVDFSVSVVRRVRGQAQRGVQSVSLTAR